MNKYFFAFVTGFTLLLSSVAIGQRNNKDIDYIDYYHQFLNDAFKIFSTGNKSDLLRRPLKVIQDSAALLKDDSPPAENIHILNPVQNKKPLSGEEIFSTRKNSVFIVGKFYKYKDSTGVKFNLMGTAFVIAKNGTCATNYHVFQDIILKKADSNDSIYFVISADKKIYFLDQILAYSQNNDIAIFKINSRADKFDPIPFGKPAQVGGTVFCLGHPEGYFYYFSKGIVARNVTIDSQQAAAGYNPNGKPPIRMEITADYAVGSSGGPILDKYGNIIGIVSSTATISSAVGQTQMVIKDAIPVKALRELLKK